MGKEVIRIFLTGGHTGGHILPLIYVAQEIKKKAVSLNLEVEFFFLGPKPVFWLEKMLTAENIKTYFLSGAKLRRYLSFLNFIDALKLPWLFLKIILITFIKMPNAIFSKGGGAISFLTVFAGWIFRIPAIIHESDSLPGLTNRLSAKFAKRIAISFEESKKYFPETKTILTGHPINTEDFLQPIFTQDYERYKLDPDEPLILVLGGSQGAHFINELIFASIVDLIKLAQIIHILGEKDFNEISLAIKGYLSQTQPQRINAYHPFIFIPPNEIALLMKMAKIIIARAGAGTIFEIAMSAVPSILIPLSEGVAGSHQRLNAKIFEKNKACLVLEENNATPHTLLIAVREILENVELAEKLSQNAKNFAKPKALEMISQEIWHLARMHYA